MDQPDAPHVGDIYESTRRRFDDRPRWQWKIIALHGDGDLFELARIGGRRTRRGNLFRTAAELDDNKRWRKVEAPGSQESLVPLEGGLR
jgi:hypothetical protein